MGRYVLAVMTVLSPILTSVTATIYSDWKTILSGHVNARLAGVLASLSITGVGIGTICLLGWLMWLLFTGRSRKLVKRYYFEDAQGFARALAAVATEINREIKSYQSIAKKTRRRYDFARWDQLVVVCDLATNNNNLFKADKHVDKCLKKKEFSVVSALRDPVTAGYGRIQELLSIPGNREYPYLHRAEEMALDVRTRHLEQFIAQLEVL